MAKLSRGHRNLWSLKINNQTKRNDTYSYSKDPFRTFTNFSEKLTFRTSWYERTKRTNVLNEWSPKIKINVTSMYFINSEQFVCFWLFIVFQTFLASVGKTFQRPKYDADSQLLKTQWMTNFLELLLKIVQWWIPCISVHSATLMWLPQQYFH